MYTVLSAKYANANNTAVVLQTQESGAVAASPNDRPDVWAKFQEWITAGGIPLAYAPAPLPDFSDIDNLDKAIRVLALLTRQYANALKAGTFVAKTVPDVRTDFMTLYRALS